MYTPLNVYGLLRLLIISSTFWKAIFFGTYTVLYCTYLCLLIFLLHCYMLTLKTVYCFQLNVMVTLHENHIVCRVVQSLHSNHMQTHTACLQRYTSMIYIWIRLVSGVCTTLHISVLKVSMSCVVNIDYLHL